MSGLAPADLNVLKLQQVQLTPLPPVGGHLSIQLEGDQAEDAFKRQRCEICLCLQFRDA
jgi:hypothetical protein